VRRSLDCPLASLRCDPRVPLRDLPHPNCSLGNFLGRRSLGVPIPDRLHRHDPNPGAMSLPPRVHDDIGSPNPPRPRYERTYFNTSHHTNTGWAVQYESSDRHRFRTRPREADGGRHRRRYPKRARNSSLNISARAPPEILGHILCWTVIPGYEFGVRLGGDRDEDIRKLWMRLVMDNLFRIPCVVLWCLVLWIS
jgi:hypothetical protein